MSLTIVRRLVESTIVAETEVLLNTAVPPQSVHLYAVTNGNAYIMGQAQDVYRPLSPRWTYAVGGNPSRSLGDRSSVRIELSMATTPESLTQDVELLRAELLELSPAPVVTADGVDVSSLYEQAACGCFVRVGTGVQVGDATYCPTCARSYSACPECGSVTRTNRLFGVTAEDGSTLRVCETCYTTRYQLIGGYHSHRHNTRHGEEGTPCFGFEVEVEHDEHNSGQMNASARRVRDAMPEGTVVFETDGSLANGFEVISEPMTHAFFKEHADAFGKALQSLSGDGYKSHDTTSCGLHVHIGRDAFGTLRCERDVTITKVVYMVERFWGDMLKLSRRTESAMERWAGRYGINGVEEADRIVANGANNDRYHCVNLTRDNTVEFRMFRGTLNPATFAATIDLCWALVNTAKRVDFATIGSADSLFSLLSEDMTEGLMEYMSARGVN